VNDECSEPFVGFTGGKKTNGHSEATRVLQKHERKGLHDGQRKIYHVSKRDLPPGKNACWSCIKNTRKRDMYFGLTITVARQQSKTVSELSFLTAVHTAKVIAKQEGISEIFVCTATTPWPTPTIPHPPAGRTSPT
jgi:hypothetical protein